MSETAPVLATSDDGSSMTAFQITEIPIRDIDIPEDRARSFSDDTAAMLAGIIAVQGLHHPIRVCAIGNRFRLISGLRRLRACQTLGRNAIAATVSAAVDDDTARLEEVMENLGRAELIALDRCRHLFDLKQVWERMYPETAHGKASPKGQSLPLSSEPREIFGFSRSLAEKVGLSDRTIRLAVKIWTGLSPASRDRLPGTDLAAKQTELKALSEQTHPKQEKILDLILGDEAPGNVAQALEFLATGVTPNAFERRFQAAVRTIAALDEDTFDNVIAAQEERILASLKRQGRI